MHIVSLDDHCWHEGDVQVKDVLSHMQREVLGQVDEEVKLAHSLREQVPFAVVKSN